MLKSTSREDFSAHQYKIGGIVSEDPVGIIDVFAKSVPLQAFLAPMLIAVGASPLTKNHVVKEDGTVKDTVLYCLKSDNNTEIEFQDVKFANNRQIFRVIVRSNREGNTSALMAEQVFGPTGGRGSSISVRFNFPNITSCIFRETITALSDGRLINSRFQQITFLGEENYKDQEEVTYHPLGSMKYSFWHIKPTFDQAKVRIKIDADINVNRKVVKYMKSISVIKNDKTEQKLGDVISSIKKVDPKIQEFIESKIRRDKFFWIQSAYLLMCPKKEVTESELKEGISINIRENLGAISIGDGSAKQNLSQSIFEKMSIYFDKFKINANL